MINYAVPETHDFEVETHSLEESPRKHHAAEMLDADQRGGAILRLVKSVNSQNEIKDWILLKDNKKALIKFSDDGRFFAYYLKKAQQIRVCEIKDGRIEDLINQIRKNDFYAKKDRKASDEDFEFINQIEFDLSNKYLVCYGDTTVMLWNMKGL